MLAQVHIKAVSLFVLSVLGKYGQEPLLPKAIFGA